MTAKHKKLCKRCNEPTDRHITADYCWACLPIIDRENRLARKEKKLKETRKVS